jgi:hypothetical protein
MILASRVFRDGLVRFVIADFPGCEAGILPPHGQQKARAVSAGSEENRRGSI